MIVALFVALGVVVAWLALREYERAHGPTAFTRLVSQAPSRQYEFRYERDDGEFRTISVPVGHGRFRVGTEKQAREVADRVLHRQFGEGAFVLEQQHQERDPGYLDPTCERIRQSPTLHHDNYSFVAAKRTK